MRRAAASLGFVLLLGACDGAPSAAPTGPSPMSVGGAFRPRPDEPIPRGGAAIAAALERATEELRRSIGAWIEEGGSSTWPPPRPLVLQALYQQRIYGVLASRPRLADRAIAVLPDDIRDEVRANVGAGAELLSLVGPVTGTPDFRTRRPPPADVLLAHYVEAEDRFGVDWEVLAAVNFVESKFGRVTSASSAGARGPMQFIPSTWRAYGMGGDVHDPRDAILGAANYLRASGAPHDYRHALYRYNPSRAYVRAIRLYARQIMRDERNYYAYYNWQVFVLSPGGLEQVTGPGA